MNLLIKTASLGILALSAAVAIAERVADALPDAPEPQQSDAQTNTNPHKRATAPSIVSSPAGVPVGKLGVGGKFSFYVKSEFGPAPLITPAFTAAYRMANPIDNYPRQWKDGAGAFGRNYGAGLAAGFSAKTATFASCVILREDPRYFASENKAFGARVVHAIFFTVVDKGDSGHNRLAVSNFVGAAAGGFIGNAYLPPGYRDAPHAEQRSLIVLAFLAGGNGLSEFRPEIRHALLKMHVPFVK